MRGFLWPVLLQSVVLPLLFPFLLLISLVPSIVLHSCYVTGLKRKKSACRQCTSERSQCSCNFVTFFLFFGCKKFRKQHQLYTHCTWQKPNAESNLKSSNSFCILLEMICLFLSLSLPLVRVNAKNSIRPVHSLLKRERERREECFFPENMDQGLKAA